MNETLVGFLLFATLLLGLAIGSVAGRVRTAREHAREVKEARKQAQS